MKHELLLEQLRDFIHAFIMPLVLSVAASECSQGIGVHGFQERPFYVLTEIHGTVVLQLVRATAPSLHHSLPCKLSASRTLTTHMALHPASPVGCPSLPVAAHGGRCGAESTAPLALHYRGIRASTLLSSWATRGPIASGLYLSIMRWRAARPRDRASSW
jgi:hypothetical protein